MVVPVYAQIVNTIREKINSGNLKPGDIIDSENALSKEFGVSRMTVRKGLAILANEGYIYSIPGKGNFVQNPDITKYTIYYNEMSNIINSVDKTKLLEVRIIMPDEKLMNSLQISRNKNVILIRRLFYTGGKPVAYDMKYLLYQRGMPIVEKEIQDATFPEMISKGKHPFSLRKELIIYAEIPDEGKKRLLNIYDNLALLVVEQKLLTQDHKPLGLGITYFRGDYIKLRGINQ